MKPFTILRFVVAALVLLVSANNLKAQNFVYKPLDIKLYHTIAHMDSVMFDAFNKHDADAIMKTFAPNLEFYHDKGGLSDYNGTMQGFKNLFKNNETSGLRRVLVPGSLEVYPIPGFGAIEIATHQFIHTENGKEEIGTMKFIHTWQYSNGEWKVTRVVSVGH